MTTSDTTPAAPDPKAATLTPEDVDKQQNAAQAKERKDEKTSAARGEPPAARTDPNDTTTGPGGQSLEGRREIAGGGHIEEHTVNAPGSETLDPLAKQRRYIRSRLAKEAGAVIGRAPDQIGLFGKGETYHGNGGILVDVDTLEKHRFPDGYKFLGDEVYANSRDLPHALVDGDLAANLSGKA